MQSFATQSFLYLYLRCQTWHKTDCGLCGAVGKQVEWSLTSNLERGMSTDGFAHVVFGHTPILAAVLLLLALHGAVKEEGAILEQHTM